MSALRELIQRHPVTSYFVLAFAISWGGIVAVVGPTHLLATKQVFDSMVWVPPLLLGPSVAGLAITAACDGWRGLRALRSRLWHARVGPRWYLVALLTAPIYYVSVSLVLSAFSRAYAPAIVTTEDPGGALARGFIVGLSAGIFEELGWTGFAVPALLRRRGAFRTGLVVGVLWGAWHIVPKLLGVRALDTVDYIPLDLLCAIVSLTGFRILMVWVYERTQSLLVAMLMHASLTAGLFIAQPDVSGAALETVAVAQAIAIWVLVAVVALVRRRHIGSPTASAHRLQSNTVIESGDPVLMRPNVTLVEVDEVVLPGRSPKLLPGQLSSASAFELLYDVPSGHASSMPELPTSISLTMSGPAARSKPAESSW